MRLETCLRYYRNIKLVAKSSDRIRTFSYCSFLKKQFINDRPMIIKIQFNNPVSRINFLSYRLVHTVKGWKFLAKPKIIENDDDTEFDPADTPCEEGTGAVPHNILISKLRDCHMVQEQIEMLGSTLSLSEDDVNNRKELCNALTEALTPYFPRFKVHPFGSTMNGFGFKGCDLDICLQTTFDGTTKREYSKVNLPTLEEVRSGQFDKSDIIDLNPKLLLRFVRRIMRKHLEGLKEPVMLIRAKLPILRFYNEKYDLFCDFSCENNYALKNTKFLRFISHLDSRIAPLVKALRYWGKHHKFVGDIEMFNSYAFSLLVLYYLQNTTPPVLPSFESLISNLDYMKTKFIEDDEAMFKCLKNIQPSKNTQTIEELLRNFFFFYLYYDFSQTMLPLTSFCVPKQNFKSDEDPPADTFELSTICLQDPFRLSFNQTSSATYKYCKKFLACIIEACKLYHNPEIWHPGQESWGIISILDSTSYDSTKVIDMNKSNTFEIILKPESNINTNEIQSEKFYELASKSLKDIMEYALLFKCKPKPIRQTSKSTGTLISKFQCDVIHNTWTGRCLVEREYFTNTSFKTLLELEHQISSHIAKQKHSTQFLFQFTCCCYAIKKNTQTVLKFQLNVESGKMPPVVPIFLQDYMQTVLNHLL